MSMQSTTDRPTAAARSLTRRWIWGFIAASLAIAVVAIVLPSQTRAAPQVTFNTIDGEVISSAQLHGRLTLVNFWATTCSVCVQEMPHVVQMYRDFHERGFDVMAVAMPYDRPDWVLDYRQRHALPFKVAIDFDGKVNRAFGGIEATPTSFLIDARGTIVQRIVGAPDFVELRKTVATLLGIAG
jgi:peroxiredoxin